MTGSDDLPPANFPHHYPCVRLEHAIALLRVLRAHSSFAGLVVTEVDPTHDAHGSQIDRHIDAPAKVLAVT